LETPRVVFKAIRAARQAIGSDELESASKMPLPLQLCVKH
jgi:hypothetical protein